MGKWYDTRVLLEYPISEVLAYFGFRGPVKHTEKSDWYYSPFREERTPSFSVFLSSNTWNDFGSNEKGGIIDLVMRLANIYDRHDATEKLAEIMRSRGEDPSRTEVCRCSWKPKPVVRSAPGIVVESYHAIFGKEDLIRYAAARGISREVLDRYCYETYYHFSKNPSVTYHGVGFRTNAGGFSLRNDMKNYGKLCTSGGITTIDCNGKYGERPLSSAVVVFEGFFNFLAYIEHNRRMALAGQLPGDLSEDEISRKANLLPVSDVCVLNSVGQIGNAYDYLSAHKVINCCLDNDTAGRECYEDIQSHCIASMVLDRSGVYQPFNDYDEMLVAKALGECGEVRSRSAKI